MTPRTLARLNDARAQGRQAVLATRLPDGAQQLLLARDDAPALWDAAIPLLRRDQSGTVTIGGETWFLDVHNPRLKLLIIGAVHTTQALVRFAGPLGYDTTVIDPRSALATEERFPATRLNTAWPDEALDAIGLDARTALVALTHDPKLDDPALDRALRSPALYIGALGSRKTHAARCERLRALGHDEAALARIHAPIGLAIGAFSTAEIALSIIAEIVATMRTPPASRGNLAA